MSTVAAESQLRIEFFDFLFKQNEGWLCIAYRSPTKSNAPFTQKFFKWPSEYQKIEEHILTVSRHNDVWFCVNLLSKPERKKDNCLATDLLWADLDEVDPTEIAPSPQVVIESSPSRFQALWRLTMPLEPDLAEQYSKRLTYAVGADKSGWDLTQLLRVPFTTNFKYAERPSVQLLHALATEAPPLIFEALPPLPQLEDTGIGDWQSLPTDLPDVNTVIYKYTAALKGTSFVSIWSDPHDGSDWSKTLWRLLHLCLEAGMSAEETFVIAKNSPVNKYERDNRPLTHLWRDVLKAELAQKNVNVITANFRPLTMPNLVPEPASETFIDEYHTWGVEATDAVPAFHDLCAFILSSAIVANSVRLETTYGQIVPNLWGMILGDSTLTRKTTAMRMVMDILQVIDPEIVLATDGSAEGLLTGLETRPNRSSLFFRDELSGFFDAINKKDYLAGMPETLTALYDVPPLYSRRLRKEVIRIESPIFIFLGGGVRDKVYENLTEEYVLSGFLPRFLVVSGDTDLDRLRRTSPANDTGTTKRAAIVAKCADLYENYASEVTIKVGGEKMRMPPRVMVDLDEDAWKEYWRIEEYMVRVANESSIPGLAMPTFERLSRSLLKMSLVLAALRQTPQDSRIKVIRDDVVNAAWYIQDWGRYSVDLVSNTGKGFGEKLLEKITRAIATNPGILRSTIMKHYHLTKKQADDVLGTLEDRQMVRKQQQGRGWSYWIA